MRLTSTMLPSYRMTSGTITRRPNPTEVLMRSCPRTRAYVTRRTAEGKTPREIRRCLKRYIARELYRQLTRSMNLPAGP